MKRYRNILLDLDGTLIDTGEGVIHAFEYAFERLGKRVPRERLFTYIGPPLLGSFMEELSDEKKSREGIEFFREYYGSKGAYEVVAFAGMEELLGRLRADGRRLYVATAKLERFARQVLEHCGLTHYFDRIVGSAHDSGATEKTLVVAQALRKGGLLPADTVMVGDREYDIIGAHKNGLWAIGVLYGFGDRQELEAAGADLLAESVEALGGLLL